MIQELLGTTNSSLIGSERKMFSINNNNSQGAIQATSVPHHSISPSPSSGAINSAVNSPAPENLRCPRCDSANTKFCYYNNYNLTQPRHFCKTCRRYWTKGGALRNVPIGGGCRKNKSPVTVTPSSSSSTSSAVTAVKSIAAKMKTTESPGLTGFDFNDVHFPASPVLWGSPQNSHLLALLRSAQNYHQSPSPNPNPNPSLSPSFLGRSLGLDPVGQGPPLGLCSSYWRSSSPLANQNQQSGFTLVDHQSNGNAGIQELYQRLKSSSGNFNNDQTAVVLSQNHVGSSPSSVIESAPVTGGGGEQLGFWSNNSAFSWSDLPATTTTNGAYP